MQFPYIKHYLRETKHINIFNKHIETLIRRTRTLCNRSRWRCWDANFRGRRRTKEPGEGFIKSECTVKIMICQIAAIRNIPKVIDTKLSRDAQIGNIQVPWSRSCNFHFRIKRVSVLWVLEIV